MPERPTAVCSVQRTARWSRQKAVTVLSLLSALDPFTSAAGVSSTNNSTSAAWSELARCLLNKEVTCVATASASAARTASVALGVAVPGCSPSVGEDDAAGGGAV